MTVRDVDGAVFLRGFCGGGRCSVVRHSGHCLCAAGVSTPAFAAETSASIEGTNNSVTETALAAIAVFF